MDDCEYQVVRKRKLPLFLQVLQVDGLRRLESLVDWHSRVIAWVGWDVMRGWVGVRVDGLHLGVPDSVGFAEHNGAGLGLGCDEGKNVVQRR